MVFFSCSGGSGHHQPSIPFLSLTNPLPQAHKPLGSKICRWVNNDGTVCGKAFSKLDSLRRHVNELHKGCRPFGCNMCDKNYGRRDYLDRHIRTHDPDNQKMRSIYQLTLWSEETGDPLLDQSETSTEPFDVVPTDQKKRTDVSEVECLV